MEGCEGSGDGINSGSGDRPSEFSVQIHLTNGAPSRNDADVRSASHVDSTPLKVRGGEEPEDAALAEEDHDSVGVRCPVGGVLFIDDIIVTSYRPRRMSQTQQHSLS